MDKAYTLGQSAHLFDHATGEFVGVVDKNGKETMLVKSEVDPVTGGISLNGDFDVSVSAKFSNYAGTISADDPVKTDARQAIQQALNAASTVIGSGYYSYLVRRSKTVKLQPGAYYISSPSTGASLVIPAGVTFDCSDATLYFDYPATQRVDWCGIQVNQYANLHVGKMYPTHGSSAPSSDIYYDAIRLVKTDNLSHVMGYKDSEIKGFQGAEIRGVGCWITHIKGIRFTDGKYGYVASNVGTAFASLYQSAPDDPFVGSTRTHTDIWFDDCSFTNLSHGCFYGMVSGDTGDVNALTYSKSGLRVRFSGCTFENCGSAAIHLANAMLFSMDSCHLEEVGDGNGMVWADTVRNFIINDLMVNFSGRAVPGPSGIVTPNPPVVFKLASVQSVIVDGVYCHNTYRPTFSLFSGSAALGFSIRGVFTDANAFTADALYGGVSGANYGNNYAGVPLLAPSSVSWNGDTYMYRDDAAGSVGLFNGANPHNFRVYKTKTDASNYERIGVNWSGSIAVIGTENAGSGQLRSLRLNGVAIQLASFGTVYSVQDGNSFHPNTVGQIPLGQGDLGWKGLYIDYTTSAAVGAQTINKANGSFQVAAGTTSVTITNSLITAKSNVFCVIKSADSAAIIKNVVPSAGSFIVNFGTAPAVQCTVGFFVVGAD